MSTSKEGSVESAQKRSCSSCGVELSEGVRFCSQCGKRVEGIRASLSGRGVLVLTLAAAGLWGFSAYTSWFLAGEKPSRNYSDLPASHSQIRKAPELNPQILTAKEQAEASKTDLAAWQNLEGLIKKEIAAHPEYAGGYLPLLIQALEEQHGLEPQESEIMVALADLHFQIRDFEQSSKYYEKALVVEPEDPTITARLASSLSFQQEFDKAISLLKAVLQKSPEHFQARAYLAIALSQKGDRQAAIREGEVALTHAPSEEARARFSGFLQKVKRSDKKEGAEEGQKTDSPALSKGAIALIAHVQSSPVAGPKLVGTGQNGARLELTFRDFPMDKMPPFAKKKFFDGLKQFAAQNKIDDVQGIRFLDEVTGGEMEQLTLR